MPHCKHHRRNRHERSDVRTPRQPVDPVRSAIFRLDGVLQAKKLRSPRVPPRNTCQHTLRRSLCRRHPFILLGTNIAEVPVTTAMPAFALRAVSGIAHRRLDLINHESMLSCPPGFLTTRRNAVSHCPWLRHVRPSVAKAETQMRSEGPPLASKEKPLSPTKQRSHTQ